MSIITSPDRRKDHPTDDQFANLSLVAASLQTLFQVVQHCKAALSEASGNEWAFVFITRIKNGHERTQAEKPAL